MKKFLIGLLAGLLLVLVGRLVANMFNDDAKYTRYEVHSAEGKNNLEAMDKALRIMRDLPCENPLSWYYQGAMHWIPDTINHNQLCSWYGNVSQIKDGWDNCTHSPSGKEKLHFLVWHRLYTWHFEKIVRKFSGYEEFALPYWDYTNAQHRVLPDMLRSNTSSLYEPCRFQDLNNGKPIQGEIERALDMTKLMSYTSYSTFCMNMNAAPHGAMHDYIGAGNDTTGLLKFNNTITGTVTNTGLMGWVPTAAFDPVFWLHHSNIDRLWQQWSNSPNGKAVMYEELKDAPWSYVFFDENGQKVEYTIEQALDIAYNGMDYNFDDTKVKTPKTPGLLTGHKEKVLLSTSTPIAINSQITDAVTQLPLKGDHSLTVKLILTVSYTKMPHGVYEVYVNNGNGFKGASDEEFAGFMTFFGTDHKMSGESCKKGCCTPLTTEGRPTFTFEYEIPYSHVNKIQIYKHNGKHTGDLIIEKIEIKQ
jgi:hypothetical protein